MATITKRPNGSYHFMVSEGYDNNGKQIRRTMTWRPPEGLTPRQIEKAIKEQEVNFEQSIRNKTTIVSSITFQEYTKIFMETYARKQLAPRTVSRYDSLLERILPEIGHLRLDKITSQRLTEFYNNLGMEKSNKAETFIASTYFEKAVKARKLTKIALSDKSGVCLSAVYAAFRGDSVSKQTAENLSKCLSIPFSKGFCNTKADTGLSNKTKQHYHRLISAILNKAVRQEILVSNPASRVDLITPEKPDIKFLNEEQVARMFKLFEERNAPYQNVVQIRLLTATGMRRGEACALTWEDIEFENNLIYIRNSMSYIPEFGVFSGKTKTLSSKRHVPVADSMLKLLKEFKAYQDNLTMMLGGEWLQHNYVFRNSNGGPLMPDIITSWFSKFIKKTDLPHVSVHSLRHTAASIMLSRGIPINTVAEILGHSMCSTTLNMYGHSMDKNKKLAASLMARIMDGEVEEPDDPIEPPESTTVKNNIIRFPA